MDGFRRILNLIFPAVLTIAGVSMVVVALTGWSKSFEDNENPNMQRMLDRFGKTKVRIFYAVFGAAVLGVGLWLLNGWLFVNQP